jgi:hypothetical protein
MLFITYFCSVAWWTGYRLVLLTKHKHSDKSIIAIGANFRGYITDI